MVRAVVEGYFVDWEGEVGVRLVDGATSLCSDGGNLFGTAFIWS